MRRRFVLVVVAVCLLFPVAAAAQAVMPPGFSQCTGCINISFATFPSGAQVPSADVSTTTFRSGSVMADQFSGAGVHFNSTGLLLEAQTGTGVDGFSTSPDGWCPTGGYNCANNIILENSPMGNDPANGTNTLDTIKITFDLAQTRVQMDIDNGYLGESPETTLNLFSGGVSVETLTLVESCPAGGCPSGTISEIAACPNSQNSSQLCGRFQIDAPSGKTFDEIDILPTTIAGSPAACTITTSGHAGVIGPGGAGSNYDANCGGSEIDNLSFAVSDVPPVAVATASPSLPVCAGALVVVDGSASTSALPLTYTWTELNNLVFYPTPATGVTASFNAPDPGGVPETLTILLSVSDTFGTGTARANVTIKPDNQSPVAQALINGSSSSTVTSASAVTLDGSQSYDPDGDPIGSYSWVQTGGTGVILNNATTMQPSFTAPNIAYPSSATLTFALTVTDAPHNFECGGPLQSTPASVTVNVAGVNHAPIANPGSNQTVISTSQVTLNGSGSLDPDGDLISYQWTQTAGTHVSLLNAGTAMPQFVAPDEPAGAQETLTFQLVVTDQPAAGYTPLQTTATVTITVQDPFAAPDCSKAVASQTTLWPPDHGMVGPLTIMNTTDNAPGRVTITINSIFQDEPTSGLGSGDTSPDAKINANGTFFLRAERSGTGDGRVYHVAFNASNAYGGSCSGAVTVCVPHDKGKASACVDEGPLYDSTQ